MLEGPRTGGLRDAGGVSDDSDDLLAEDVERIAGEARRLDVAFVHGPGDGGAGHQVGPVLREEDTLTDSVDGVSGAANPLHPAGDRWRSFDLDDEVDRAHIDAQARAWRWRRGL